MAKKLTNVETYLGILFLFGVLIAGLTLLSLEILSNDNSNLDNNSKNYISNLTKINVTYYETDSDDLISPTLLGTNNSGNPKDESLDYLKAVEEATKLEKIIKNILYLPKYILIDLLKFNMGDWTWLLSVLNFLYWLSIIIALIYFARGIIVQ